MKDYVQHQLTKISKSIIQRFPLIINETWEIVHQIKFNEPIISFDASPDSSTFALGTSEGNVIIKKKKKEESDSNEPEEDFPLPDFVKSGDPFYKARIKNFQYFNRGIYQRPAAFDIKV
mgnify:CR=1 FL=1